MIASLRKSVNALKKDKEHGAGWLTAQAMHILQEASSGSSARNIRTFLEEIEQVASAIMEARPFMVSVSNYAMQFKDEFEATAPESKSADNLKKRAAAIARKLLLHGEIASSQAARNAAKLIKPRMIVMTCSYSSDVCSALEQARGKGIDFKVLAVESRPDRIPYGEITVNRLAKAGVACRIVPDNFIAWHAARANMILIGADAVSLQGWIINGFPSYSLAVTAARKKVPVYLVCTFAKFDARGFLAGPGKPEPGFDTVPLELLKGVVTDKGILQPADVYKVSTADIFRSRSAGPH